MKRFRVSLALATVAILALVLSAQAAAETRTGESTSPEILGAATPETTLVKSSASYDMAGGSIGFEVTTAAVPLEGALSQVRMTATLLSPTGECSLKGLLSAVESEDTASLLPVVAIVDEYKEPAAAGAEILSRGGEVPTPLPATKTVSGATTTLSFSSSAVANKGYDCALVEANDPSGGGAGVGSAMVFPISAPPPAPPTPAPPAPVPPTPAPAALSIGRLKPLKLKAEKWKTVKVKVTNIGGTSTAQGSLRVKAPRGVLVKPERQKLPVLDPGTSWTLSVRVQLTEKARPKSTLSLTGTASGASVKGSFVVKLTG